ncbi:MAG: PQQ-binding-like beta-propeller repeat protein [Gammaproteobacteria bacterium]|nr:PQQ-binding-like beta-propeller repeat protein [Gammaproteobacteria bacterium]
MSNNIKEIVLREQTKQQLVIHENRQQLIRKYCTEQRHELLEDAGCVRRLALSLDDKLVAGAADNVVCVWDADSYERVDRQVFDFSISAIGISACRSQLLVGDVNSNSLWVTELRGPARSRTYEMDSPITVIAAAADGHCAVGTASGDVHYIDPSRGTLLLQVSCGEWLRQMRVYSDKGVLFVESDDGESLYSLEDGRELDEAPAGVPIVCSTGNGIRVSNTAEEPVEITTWSGDMDYSRDGARVVTAGFNGSTVWSGQTGERLGRVHTYGHGPSDLKVSADGRFMYICGGDSTVDKYSLTGGRYGTLADTYCPVMAAAQSGRHLMVVDQRGVLAQYDLLTGDAQRYYHHECCVSKMDVLGDLVATGAYDGTARVLDISTGKVIACIRHRGVPSQAVALHEDGMLVTGTRNGRLRRHDIETGKPVQEYHGNSAAIRCAAVSPCGRYVLSTSDMGDVLVFDYASGKLRHQRSDSSIIYSGCFDDTGEYIFYGTGGGYVVKARSADGAVLERWRLHTSNVRSVAMCDGRLVSIGIHDNACITDPHSGSIALCCRINAPLFRRVAFINAEQSRLVTGGQDGRLRFHDINDGRILAELHNLGTGYLWTTENNDEQSPHWFCTDRPEMIQLYERLGDIETLVPPTDQRHRDYVQALNSRVATMARVGMCKDAISRDVAALCDSFREKLQRANQRALLEHSPDAE